MHLNAAGQEGAAVFAHVARSAQMHLDAIIFNIKQPKMEVYLPNSSAISKQIHSLR